jgi:tripartite-type tricarboxylate transporter receptor subunit TctC
MLSQRLLRGAALAAPFPARAETWPTRPIRVILPGPVGGLIDIAGRAIGVPCRRNSASPG